MHKLEIHPNAAASFNEKATALVSKLSPPAPRPERPSAFRSETVVAHHLTKDEILGPPIVGLVDFTGRELARYFQHAGGTLGLHGDDFAAAMKLAESFQKCKEITGFLSHGFLVDRLFDWLQKKHQDPATASFVEFTLSESEPLIIKNDIWIPISGLHIQSPFSIGRVMLKPITQSMFDDWEKKVAEKAGVHTEKALQLVARERKQLQGLAAATIELLAEPERAREIAFEEADAAISALRFFEGANFEPAVVSYCAPIGHRPPAFRKHLTLREGMLGTVAQHLTERSDDWSLSDEKITNLNRDGLQVLSEIIGRDNPLTEFEDRLLAALMIYSRNSLERLPTGKLIYILSALESLLLRNSTEGIEQNLGERMAFVIAKDVPNRKAVISNIKEVYRLRSQFLHHGVTIENREALRVFMRNAWVFLHSMLQNTRKLKTMDNLFDSIEHIKLS